MYNNQLSFTTTSNFLNLFNLVIILKILSIFLLEIKGVTIVKFFLSEKIFFKKSELLKKYRKLYSQKASQI
ncbi:hypothetical protein GW891_04540 [bacterium]|nr:hypothetical protein [bacterium]